MGERGPLPNENARRRNVREVRGAIEVETPAQPEGLGEEAQAEWARVVPRLEELGILSHLDRGLLVRYCTAWADWVALDKTMQGTQPIVRGRDGNLVRNPVWLMRRDADLLVTQLGAQLGLTPIARLRSGIKHERPKQVEDALPANVSELRARLSKGGRRGR